MTPEGPRTADGLVHEVDCIIYGTGFKTTEFMFPMQITGGGGRSLRDVWDRRRPRPPGHLGAGVPVAVPHVRPEHQHLRRLDHLLPRGAGPLRPAGARSSRRERGAASTSAPSVEAASDQPVQARFTGTAWTQCDSWYRNEAGRVVANWPDYMRDYAAATRVLDATDYDLVQPRQVAAVS